jgi:hypothetical protein
MCSVACIFPLQELNKQMPYILLASIILLSLMTVGIKELLPGHFNL